MIYRVIRRPAADLLENIVQEHLDLGWELQGGASVAYDDNGRSLFVQALIKRKVI